MPEAQSVLLTYDEAEELRLNLCDFICWFSGFEAAHVHAEIQPGVPSSLHEIRNFNADLANICRRLREHAKAGLAVDRESAEIAREMSSQRGNSSIPAFLRGTNDEAKR